MNIYEATKIVREHFQNSIPENVVQISAIYGYCKGQIIKFRSKSDASYLNDGMGYLFECKFHNGVIDIEPFT